MSKELQLIAMVERLQAEQHKYFKEKRQYGNSPTQLELCKKLESELKKYCADRKKEIENEQQLKLFN